MVGLLRAVPSLVSILRYGTARAMPREELSDLARALANEVVAGLGLACSSLDDAAAEQMHRAVVAFDAALVLFGDEHLSEEWNSRLRRLADDASVAPLVAGAALRLLYDRAGIDGEATTAAFFRALSPAVAPKAAGQWLEGFLGSTAEVILQDRTLLDLIDAWLGEQKETDFIEVLPMLRRAFDGFSATGRRRLLAEVSKGPVAERMSPAQSIAADSPGFQKALPLLLTILGIERRE